MNLWASPEAVSYLKIPPHHVVIHKSSPLRQSYPISFELARYVQVSSEYAKEEKITHTIIIVKIVVVFIITSIKV